MKNKPSSGKRVAKRRFFKADERFATKAVIVIAITTAAFIVAQYVSFLITRQEQTVLIEWYFRAVVIECGAMMMKRLSYTINIQHLLSLVKLLNPRRIHRNVRL